MDAIEQETWTVIPGHEMYEVGPDYRVRSWKVRGSIIGTRADEPHTMFGKVWKGQTYYCLDGEETSLTDILLRTFGDGHAMAYLGALERELPRWQVAEIRECEGLKYAREVARDFRIDAFRVRRIWDGLEA